MSDVEECRRSPSLPRLPPELAPIILHQVPDALTLRNLILSSPSFYHGFCSSPKSILAAVLLNEFGPRLLPVALAAYEASHLSEAGFDSARHDLLSAMQNIPRVPDKWTFTDSIALSKVHGDVDYFASEFASTFNQPSKEAILIDGEPATRTEMERIRIALFRFELYCNLYRSSPNLSTSKQQRPSWDERKEQFLDRFSPWENEQLFTMYEYLLKRMSIGWSAFGSNGTFSLTCLAFKDVAEHDVLWGKHRIRDGRCYKEHCLSLGLAWLHRLATAATYDERYKLLAPETGESKPDFLWKTVAYPQQDAQYNSIELEEFTELTVLDHVNPSFFEDLDIGPFTAWWWAYKSSTDAVTYALHELKPLRKMGYIMFDIDRLRRRGMLDSPFDPVYQSQEKFQEKKAARIRKRERLEHSCRKRSEIYDAGGRGYWSEDDESKLIWGIPRPEDGIELTLPGWGYLDYWKDGILVDRERWDLYMTGDDDL